MIEYQLKIEKLCLFTIDEKQKKVLKKPLLQIVLFL